MPADKLTPIGSFDKEKIGLKLLNYSSTFWFICTTIGQWIFGYYIVAVYHTSTFSGDFAKWNEVLPKGYIEGDWKGNLIVAIHVVLAAIIVLGGPLQIMPQIRNRFKTFHSWLGRIYVFTAIIISLAGLIMVWTRGTVGDVIQHINISIQAIYIISFAILTIYFARKRQIETHKKWALRLFMVSSGVWFFRLGLMAWLVVNKAPVGFDPETFSGPFLTVLSTLAYSIPLTLIVLELYFYTQKRKNQALNIFTSIIIFCLTLLMALGIFGATMGLWLPRI